jgi:YbbR domain-containing protein
MRNYYTGELSVNYRALAKIACRLFAIYTFIKFVSYLPAVTYPLFMKNTTIDESLAIIPVLLSLILFLLLSIILWNFSEKISGLIVNDLNTLEETNIDYNRLQYIAFSVVGLVLVVLSVPDIIKTSIEISQMFSIMRSTHPTFIQYKAKLEAYIVQSLIGL